MRSIYLTCFVFAILLVYEGVFTSEAIAQEKIERIDLPPTVIYGNPDRPTYERPSQRFGPSDLPKHEPSKLRPTPQTSNEARFDVPKASSEDSENELQNEEQSQNLNTRDTYEASFGNFFRGRAESRLVISMLMPRSIDIGVFVPMEFQDPLKYRIIQTSPYWAAAIGRSIDNFITTHEIMEHRFWREIRATENPSYWYPGYWY